ncbi:MAG TPA: LacI family DNA-binding transcriptional regulator [Tepidisphaeraceae bacterium]|jgi:DNA-binding LacI/PurR family transcriptional regulator
MSITRVAKIAGVSSSTVSRVINNHPKVAPHTLDAVRKAMKSIGYTPSDRRPGPKPAQRALARATNIAFFVLGTGARRATPAFESLLRGVSMAADQHGLNLVFNQISDPEQLTERVLGGKMDGVLLHGALPTQEPFEQIRRIPTVWLMGNRRRPKWGDQVMPNHYEVGYLAAKYLLGRGHKNLASFNLDGGHWGLALYGHAFRSTVRIDGGQAHALEMNRELTSGYWQEYSPHSVEAFVQRYLRINPRPTGLFVADDMQVAMIQPALQRAGVEIGPGRVEVVSCNNEQPYLVGLSPKPTEIDIHAESIGRRGVDHLLWRIAHAQTEERTTTIIEPFLVDGLGVRLQEHHVDHARV